MMHSRTHLLDLDDLNDRRWSKVGLAKHHYPEQTYDLALPQPWLNQVSERSNDLSYSELLSTIVWLYPGKSESPAHWISGIAAVLCFDTARELDRQGIPYYSPRGYHGQPLKKENENESTT